MTKDCQFTSTDNLQIPLGCAVLCLILIVYIKNIQSHFQNLDQFSF